MSITIKTTPEPEKKVKKRNPRWRNFGYRLNIAISSFLRLILLCLLVGSLFGGAALFVYVAELDSAVREKFEGKRWTLPARVYAQSLSLYVGAKMGPERLLFELELLQFREDSELKHPGTYSREEEEFTIRTRSYVSSAGVVPERILQFRFNLKDGSLGSIVAKDGRETPILWNLNPVEIASIYPTHNEDRMLLKRSDLPPFLVDTLLAVEDRKFYSHFGINPRSIMRALLENYKAGRSVQGASTITQQLVKNFYLTNERTYSRKVKEAFMSLILEYRYSKDEILEAYANEITLGQNGQQSVNGFGLASMFYFARPITELEPHQIALLVGLVNAPSKLNPRSNPDAALERRNLVLDVLRIRNLIDRDTSELYKQKPLDVAARPPSNITRYPAFIDLVQIQLKQDYTLDDLTNEGLLIFTTLDPAIQDIAEKGIASSLATIEKSRRMPKNTLQSAMIITDVQTGEIEAMVGDRNPRQIGYNRAITARRQPGSIVKPVIYLRALEQPRKYTLATLLDDASPVNYRPTPNSSTWSPNNYDRRLHGWIPLMTSLAKSYNVTTVKMGLDIGVSQVLETFVRLGMDSAQNIKPYPSILLGAMDITMFDFAQVYNTIASGGYRTKLRTVREITSAQGVPVNRYALNAEQVVYPGAAYLVTTAMQEVVRAGTAASMKKSLKDLRIAGKTGTTDEHRDSWFVGFSGDTLAISWVGRDDNKPIRGLTGSNGALRVWEEVMRKIPMEPIPDDPPSDIVMASVDLNSGLLVNRSCPGNARSIPFIKGTQPKETTSCYRPPADDVYYEEETTTAPGAWRNNADYVR